MVRLARRLFHAALLICVAGCAGAVSDEDRAHFVVRERVITPEITPFTATIGRFGNGAKLMPNGGFEPMILRDMFLATHPAANRVIAAPGALSGQDSWREGALDGAEVEILRIVDGRFRSIRRDRVALGGHHASGWIRMYGGQGIPGERHGITLTLPDWYRPGVPYHFMLRSVGADGRMSKPSRAVAAIPREGVKKRDVKAELIRMETGKTGRSQLPPPRNLRARPGPSGIELSWTPVDDAVGYALFRSDLPPERHTGYGLELAGDGPGILAGDLVILRNRALRADRNRLLSNRVWNAGAVKRQLVPGLLPGWSDSAGGGNWQLVAHEPGGPVPDPGETFLRVSLDKGETLRIGATNHAGLAQDWYPVLEPGRRYRFELWARGRSPRTQAFLLRGYHAGLEGGAIGPFPFRVTPGWQRVSASFSVPHPDPGKRAGRMELVLTGPGVFDIDNLRVYREEADYLALLPEDLARLQRSGMAMLRSHGLIKTGRRSYDLAQLTNPGGVTSGIGGGNTLPQTLREIARLGMDPWLQIEPHLSEAEWLGLVEYLAAAFDPGSDDPTTRPWAAKRVAQGRRVPWSDAFDRIGFEIGNETWNRLFAPWTFPPMRDAANGKRYSAGAVYGLYQEYVLSILRQSPHWPRLAPKLMPVLGGRAGLGGTGADYGIEAARHSPGSQLLAHAGYIGGWEQKAGPATPDAEGLSRVLTHVLQTGAPMAARFSGAAAEISGRTGQVLSAGTYEAGPGYVMNGLNGWRMNDAEEALQQQAMRSPAAATATLDSFLARASAGLRLQNFFVYGDGTHWASHRRWQDGGGTLPPWELLALFNRVGTGEMLAVEARQVPRRDLGPARGRQAVSDAPMVAAYATRAGDRLTLILISRRVPGLPEASETGATAVTVELPFQAAERITRYAQNGTWNGTGDGAGIAVKAVPKEMAGAVFSLPMLRPGSTEIIVFDGIR